MLSYYFVEGYPYGRFPPCMGMVGSGNLAISMFIVSPPWSSLTPWFVVLLSLHDVTNNAFYVETGVVNDLTSRKSATYGDNFYEVDNVDKLWDWLNTVLVPIGFKQTVYDEFGSPALPPYEWGTVNSYNRYMGAGVSIAQTRSNVDGCSIARLDTALNMSCHPWRRPIRTSNLPA